MLRTFVPRASWPARTGGLRVLTDRDLDEAITLCDRDPLANVFVGSRLRDCGLEPARLGAQIWGFSDDGGLTSLCYSGANLVPVEATPAAVRAFAHRARQQGRRCSSIVGPAAVVARLWEGLEYAWGAPREIRPDQPVMAISSPPLVEPDPMVRVVGSAELDIVLPACIEMFTEEVGVSPLRTDGGAGYRARVGELVRAGRSYARIEHGTVVFKAEIGAVTPLCCQIQGVWVRPDRRGLGHAQRGMAAVVSAALRDVSPLVSLYVNEFNTPARAAYKRVGFTEAGKFMSVLF